MGRLVRPHKRPGPVEPLSAFSMGGATGSAATMALISLGRASASSQPEAACPEWITRMTGWPIKSTNFTAASVVGFSESPTATDWTSALAKASNTGSPILPLFGASLGHCVYFLACGQLLCGVAGGRPPDQTSSINGPERGGTNSPSTPGI